METILKNEYEQLKEIVKIAEKRLKNAPEGRLRTLKKGNRVEFYYKCEGENCGKQRYLRKKDQNIITEIVQRDYDTSILRKAKERMCLIDSFLKKYEKTSLKNVHKKMSEFRKKVVNPFIISDEEYVKKWQELHYTGKGFMEDMPVILTEKGERVRSKSEKIIADKLYSLGIPYHYEKPIVLHNNIKTYPDFTILKMPEREEVYLEHFGLMDDSNYVEKVMWKLNTYERNGIYLGVNLYITCETGKMPLNTKGFAEMINKIFCEEK